MGVAFRELAGSPEEVFGPEGMRARRRIVVAWEDRHAMVAELLGADGASAPAAYPQRAEVAASEVRIEPWPAVPEAQAAFDDVAAQLNSYSGRLAQLIVDYEWVESEVLSILPQPTPGTSLTYRLDFGGEYATLSGVSLHWSSDGALPVPADALPMVRVPIAEHQVTWHRVSNPPWEAIRAATGTLNQDVFLGAAAGTLLFDGATAVRQFRGFGALQQPTFGWKLTYLFREKAIQVGGQTYGWNHRYRALPATNPGWDKLVDSAGRNLYAYGNFAALFQMAAV